MSATAESFLDELVTWRELGLNRLRPPPRLVDRYESLPDWARETLADHAAIRGPTCTRWRSSSGPRPTTSSGTRRRTSCAIEGRIHNYLRMLWGKKILHWSESPRARSRR